jgi:voltage-gated potassium channel
MLAVVPTRRRRSAVEQSTAAGSRYQPSAVRRLWIALLALTSVLVLGTIGYVLLGIDLLDAAYQTVTTVTTIGFREVVEFDARDKVFTMVLALVGVGTVLYTLTLVLELVLEGQLGNVWGRRRMERDIARTSDHAVICGWGRVGRAAAEQIARTGAGVVVVDRDEARLETCEYPHVLGDATDDECLRSAGILQARTLVAALDTDAASVYAVLSARTLNPGLFVIARSRTDDAEAKFVRAGADRVVNPQRIGGNRIAAFAESPDVVDFLDVVMHDSGHEFRLVDIGVHEDSPLSGATVDDARSMDVVVLALRTAGSFVTNPADETPLKPGDVLIVVGAEPQVDALHRKAHA